MKKLSIIVPIYNEEKYLEECLDSIINQTLEDIEIICVNDGSTDGSKDIIDKYALKDSRIIAIHKENTGNGNTMNRGLEIASGEYIACVESDDFIMPYMFETLYALTENGAVDIVKGNFWDCYDEKDGSLTKVTNRERSEMPDIDVPFTVRDYPQILWGHPSIWSAIYRRNFIESNHISFKEVKGAGWVDNPFFFETMSCAEKIKWTKEPLYCYRKLNLVSSSNGYDLAIPFERMIDNLEAIEKHNTNSREILRFAYARALMYLVGATQEKHYEKKRDYARPYMQKMLKKLDSDIITEDFHLNDQKNYHKYISPLATIMPKTAKVLIYNWLPFDNPQGIGGGVTIYCKNLIAALLHYRPDVTVYFLSSGWAYDISREECYVRTLPNIFGERCRSFEIVNSPVPAPQDMLFKNPSVAFENETLKSVVGDFVRDYGTFDIIHFNNLEGLSLDVFDLKEDFPNTNFVYSLHNYIPFCMTGFYYQRHKHCNCLPNRDSSECESCIMREKHPRHYRDEMIQRGQFGIPDINAYDEWEWSRKFEFERLDNVKENSFFSEFTKKATNSLNKNMDTILAVSEKVRKLAIENGICEEKVETNYIGTKVASCQIGCSAADPCDAQYLKLVYLGSNLDYEEKGYPFLLKALAHMKESTAAKIDLVLTTTTPNRDAEIRKNLRHFHQVKIIHGYSHKELPNILKGVHLGILPVLWEDNLPQIAIEMTAHGVPVLFSDCGGASELCTSSMFHFKGGDVEDFLKQLTYLTEHREKIQEFWIYHSGLTTMKKHIDEISAFYKLPEKPTAKLSLEDYSLLLEENEFLTKYFNGENRAVYDNQNTVTKELFDRIQQERDYLQYSLDETRKSVTYKIGRAITAIPRKIKSNLK